MNGTMFPDAAPRGKYATGARLLRKLTSIADGTSLRTGLQTDLPTDRLAMPEMASMIEKRDGILKIAACAISK
jgi:hypothetical protein